MDQVSVTIEFPLRGEWVAPTTPATKIPSHGTNRMGLRYAFDFLQKEWLGKKWSIHDAGTLQGILFGVPLSKYYCWGQPIYAPFDGEVIEVVNTIQEKQSIHWINVMANGLKNAATFDENRDEYSQLAGNYIIIKHSDTVYGLVAHLKFNSSTVTVKQQVRKGTILGEVGHSGNSTSPHLHFQLMTSDNIAHAKGIPCNFEKYEVYRNGFWKTVYNEIPTEEERIRFLG